MQKNRRIYSLNIISYLAMNNIEFKLLMDNVIQTLVCKIYTEYSVLDDIFNQ